MTANFYDYKDYHIRDNNGLCVLIRRKHRATVEGETLATAWRSDGETGLLANIFEAGFLKGKKAGREEAFADLRRLIGAKA